MKFTLDLNKDANTSNEITTESDTDKIDDTTENVVNSNIKPKSPDHATSTNFDMFTKLNNDTNGAIIQVEVPIDDDDDDDDKSDYVNKGKFIFFWIMFYHISQLRENKYPLVMLTQGNSSDHR